MHESFLYQLGSTPCRNVSRLFELDADFMLKGVWSGVADLVALAYKELKECQQTDIIDQHNYALYHVLASYRGEIGLKYGSLTDTSQGSEKTRNFPLDRAYRLVHSLIALIRHWKQCVEPDQNWAIVVRNFDRTEHLSRRFFVECGRRLPDACAITVFADTPDEKLAAQISPRPMAQTTLDLSQTQADSGSPWEESFTASLKTLPDTDPLKAARIAIKAITLYNHYGYYYESHAFAPLVIPHLQSLAGEDENLLWSYMGNIYQGYITTGKETLALRWLLDSVDNKLSQPMTRAKFNYVLAITYLRYHKPPDIEAAERHMLMAASYLTAGKDDTSPEDYAFLRVFINNGLAFVRVRQNRQDEALQLCKEGYDFLTKALGEHKHRLHRSVLLYNTAQVYQSVGRLKEALRFFQMAAEMDPYYSEYHNDIGNILQNIGDYESALKSYQRAISYSAPYAEVYFNKGVCHYHLAQWPEALASFQESLTLEPDLADALLLLAEVLEQLGHSSEERLHLYSRVIALNPHSVIARVNRANLHYENESWDAALVDMGFAIDEQPTSVEHLENRAAIYRAMGLGDLAQLDENQALRLVERKIHA